LFQKAKKNELSVFVPVLALSCEAGFPPTTREKGKKEKRGGGKKECPPKRATEIKLLKEKPSATLKGQLMFLARGEADTEQGCKIVETLARPPIGGPSECRGGSANSLLGWVGKYSNQKEFQ